MNHDLSKAERAREPLRMYYPDDPESSAIDLVADILPKHGYRGSVSNNVTELAAVVCGLSKLPDNWKGIVYSDSWVTLQRVFHRAKLNNVPQWLQDKLETEVYRLDLPGRHIYELRSIDSQLAHLRRRGITYVLLDGHPTKAQLAEGIGKRGNPVSEHNVWCDQECGRIGKEYLQSMQEEVQDERP